MFRRWPCSAKTLKFGTRPRCASALNWATTALSARARTWTWTSAWADNCKLQNGVFLFHGVSVEDGVFFGPGAILTNDRLPRAITPDGALKTDDDWEEGHIVVRYGASIGARAVILPGVEIGRFALVGAGSVVTHDVPTQGLVYGNPARLAGLRVRMWAALGASWRRMALRAL